MNITQKSYNSLAVNNLVRPMPDHPTLQESVGISIKLIVAACTLACLSFGAAVGHTILRLF